MFWIGLVVLGIVVAFALTRIRPQAPSTQIVEAVGNATSKRTDGPLAMAIEQAMSQAVLEAINEGISDPDVIRARKLSVREAVKAARRGY
jgi:hypothetical protein